jgi:hypothetical protein
VQRKVLAEFRRIKALLIICSCVHCAIFSRCDFATLKYHTGDLFMSLLSNHCLLLFAIPFGTGKRNENEETPIKGVRKTTKKKKYEKCARA